jgi:monoamine oxidase
MAIVGGGLTGLLLAKLLQDSGQAFVLLEARDRLGGRILSRYLSPTAPIEMGATWLGRQHTQLLMLLEQLGLQTFEQQLGDRAIYEPISTSPPQLVQLPPNDNPSFRIQGGTSRLIQALSEELPQDQLLLGQAVRGMQLQEQGVALQTDTLFVEAQQVVSTLPPNLLLSRVELEPALPDSLLAIARQTHTWMGESIKVGLVYEKPFWRADHLSGTLMSNVGPIPEMYDHSNVEDDFYALKGFLNGAYHSVSREERKALVLQQLRKYFGSQADTYQSYEEAVWIKEPFTYAPYSDHVLPHQHNGHAVFRQPYWQGRLFVAGSETAEQFPGYMEGAVRAAHRVFGQLMEQEA